MLRPLAGILLFVLLLAAGGQFGTLSLSPAAERNEKQPFGIAARPPWTTSRVTGTPEPPPPYRTERVFPKLKFANPVLLAAAPGTDRLFVAEQKGKLFSFRPDPACEAPDLFLDLPREIKTIDPAGAIRGVGEVYGLAFHPDFAKNRYCYVCYVLDSKTAGEQLPEGSRVSRFRVTETDPPRCDPASETVLLSWLGGGHNGGCLAFGPDGYLYISTGDGSFPNPPDARLAGQDVSNLLSSILRIDVDHPAADRPYAIPADNPFVATPGTEAG
jgi:glucose/arabinose dehydrogenase